MMNVPRAATVCLHIPEGASFRPTVAVLSVPLAPVFNFYPHLGILKACQPPASVTGSWVCRLFTGCFLSVNFPTGDYCY